MYRIWHKLWAEFIGTFVFVFFAAGAVCAAAAMHSATESALGFAAALVRGVAYAVLVVGLSPVSGGHFNPAITLGCWVTRKIGSFQAIFYGMAQVLAAIVASWTLALLVPENIWRPIALAAPELGAGISRTQGIFWELILTFAFVFVFFATVADAHSDSPCFARFGGFAAGLALFAATLAGAPFTGASLNPAFALGTAVAAHQFANHGVYWAGPLLGGVLGAWLYHAAFGRPHTPAHER